MTSAKFIPNVNQKLAFRAAQKSPRIEDRKRPHIDLILGRLRSSIPGVLARSKCQFLIHIRYKFILLLVILPIYSWAWDASPQCYKQFEQNFFNETYLDEALSLHNVYQADWNAIYRDLKSASQDLHRTIWAKGQKMGINNPLDHPFQPLPAAQLLLQTLYQVFDKVLRAHDPYSYTYNENDIYDMFAYIVNKQQPLLETCFGQTIKFERQ